MSRRKNYSTGIFHTLKNMKREGGDRRILGGGNSDSVVAERGLMNLQPSTTQNLLHCHADKS